MKALFFITALLLALAVNAQEPTTTIDDNNHLQRREPIENYSEVLKGSTYNIVDGDTVLVSRWEKTKGVIGKSCCWNVHPDYDISRGIPLSTEEGLLIELKIDKQQKETYNQIHFASVCFPKDTIIPQNELNLESFLNSQHALFENIETGERVYISNYLLNKEHENLFIMNYEGRIEMYLIKNI